MKTRTNTGQASRPTLPRELQTELSTINSRSGGRSHGRKGRKPVLLWLALLLSAALSASAQPYAIDWFTVSGGGGASSGSSYSATSSIGQPDAATLSGGIFDLTGGFLAGAEPPTPAPKLHVKQMDSMVVLWWDPATPEFELETTTNLSSPSWMPASSGSTNPVNIPVTGTAQFYRLRRR